MSVDGLSELQASKGFYSLTMYPCQETPFLRMWCSVVLLEGRIVEQQAVLS